MIALIVGRRPRVETLVLATNITTEAIAAVGRLPLAGDLSGARRPGGEQMEHPLPRTEIPIHGPPNSRACGKPANWPRAR